jgi:hypothetical protein
MEHSHYLLKALLRWYDLLLYQHIRSSASRMSPAGDAQAERQKHAQQQQIHVFFILNYSESHGWVLYGCGVWEVW